MRSGFFSFSWYGLKFGGGGGGLVGMGGLVHCGERGGDVGRGRGLGWVGGVGRGGVWGGDEGLV